MHNLYFQIRITGYRCYGFFTYANNNHTDLEWEKKLDSTIFSKFKGNDDTDYGHECETPAVKLLQAKYGADAVRNNLGLITNVNHPQFGYSPDGLIIQNGDLKLVEIKSPTKGRKSSGQQLLQQLPYLKLVNGCYKLQEKHTYYGQIQLGLHVCNAREGILVIYSSFDRSCSEIIVPRSESFIQEKLFLATLSNMYFQHYLPFLVKNKSRLRIPL